MSVSTGAWRYLNDRLDAGVGDDAECEIVLKARRSRADKEAFAIRFFFVSSRKLAYSALLSRRSLKIFSVDSHRRTLLPFERS